MGCASDVVGSSAIGSPPVLCTQTPTALRPVRSFPARPGWSSLQRLLWRLRRPWPSRAVGDPVVRRHHTSEADVGAPLIPLLSLTSLANVHPCEGVSASGSCRCTGWRRLWQSEDCPDTSSVGWSLSPLGIGVQANTAFTMSAGLTRPVIQCPLTAVPCPSMLLSRRSFDLG